MSETVHYKGKLTEVKSEDIDIKAKEILENRNLKMETYHKTNLEALCDHLYEEFFSHKGKLYSMTKEYVDIYDDIIRAKSNDDGSIDYELKYYNGGAGFSECLEEAMDKLD